MLFIVNKNYDGDIGFIDQTLNLIVMWLILEEILEISGVVWCFQKEKSEVRVFLLNGWCHILLS